MVLPWHRRPETIALELLDQAIAAAKAEIEHAAAIAAAPEPATELVPGEDDVV